MTSGTVGLGFLAGVLSTLSPCVLPILPLVLGAAVAAHRFGVVALAAGLAVSFTVIGLFVATVGFAAGLDADVFRFASAGLLVLIGIVLLSDGLQARFAVLASGAGNACHGLMARLSPDGLGGQAFIGVMLGAVWSPCVGPTLGAASLLAARGENLPQVAAVMLAFGIGAALPLLLLGALSRQAMLRWRTRMLTAGKSGKRILGVLLVVIGAAILTGADHRLETWGVEYAPAWLTDLTTRY